MSLLPDLETLETLRGAVEEVRMTLRPFLYSAERVQPGSAWHQECATRMVRLDASWHWLAQMIVQTRLDHERTRSQVPAGVQAGDEAPELEAPPRYSTDPKQEAFLTKLSQGQFANDSSPWCAWQTEGEHQSVALRRYSVRVNHAETCTEMEFLIMAPNAPAALKGFLRITGISLHAGEQGDELRATVRPL